MPAAPIASTEPHSPGPQEWSAGRCRSLTGPVLPYDASGEWHVLRQAWRPQGPETGFRAGHARASWEPTALIFDAFFTGSGQRNRSSRLNERAWELGDVCEIFVRTEAAPYYLEVHITPENQRLQLRFPLGAIQEIRAGRAELDNYFVPDPNWIESRTRIADDHVAIRARIPAAAIGIGEPLSSKVSLFVAVCRYDYHGRPDEPILSSTAALQAPFFHRITEWSLLRLSP